MQLLRDERPAEAGTKAAPEPTRPDGGLFWTIAGFGLLTGWLELGLTLARRVLDPHVSTQMLRTNRHFLWMVPLADALLFAAVGLAIVPLAWFSARFGRWLALRLALALAFSSLLLTVEGLYAIAGVVLASGLASVIGDWIENSTAATGRLVRVGIATMAVGLVGWTGVSYHRVVTSERRALAQCPPAKPGAPNVLLIVLDDVRAASLSLYGHTRPTTPNLERWARKGVVFAEARAPAPWTLPSHASMFTGRWPHELSVGPDRPLDGTFPTLAETLAGQGYATAGFVGNTQYCNARFGVDRGFSRYEDDYENQTVSLFETVRSSGLGKRLIQLLGYPIQVAIGETSVRKSAEMINRDVLQWLAEKPADQPYFAFINYYDAHSPFLPPDGPYQRFGLGVLSLEERLEIDQRYLDWKAGKPVPPDRDPAQIVSDALDVYRDSYESCIAYLDHQVGLLLAEIERRGSLQNTLVIVTSDHGEQFGRHGILGHGLSLYSREVHVPLLVIPPSRSSTVRVVNEPVSLREIAATVADCAELGPRSPFPGHSLTRFLRGRTEWLGESSPVLCEVQHMKKLSPTPRIPSSLGPVNSLVTPDLVYIRGARGREELYNLGSYENEASNLASAPESGPVIDAFRQRLNWLYRGVNAPAP